MMEGTTCADQFKCTKRDYDQRLCAADPDQYHFSVWISIVSSSRSVSIPPQNMYHLPLRISIISPSRSASIPSPDEYPFPLQMSIISPSESVSFPLNISAIFPSRSMYFFPLLISILSTIESVSLPLQISIFFPPHYHNFPLQISIIHPSRFQQFSHPGSYHFKAGFVSSEIASLTLRVHNLYPLQQPMSNCYNGTW